MWLTDKMFDCFIPTGAMIVSPVVFQVLIWAKPVICHTHTENLAMVNLMVDFKN